MRPNLNLKKNVNHDLVKEDDINNILNPSNISQSIELFDLLNNVNLTIKNFFSAPVWVIAEVSGFKKVGVHYYFDLIQLDNKGLEKAKVSAKLWSSNSYYILNYFKKITGKEIGSGIKSEWLVTLDYHPRYGFSVVIKDIKPIWTKGEQDIKKEKIREYLIKEGLYTKQKKTYTNPKILTRIAVISPNEAAGLGDFKSESDKWNDLDIIKVDFYNAIFEGDKTSSSITDKIKELNKIQEKSLNENGFLYYDLLIILRGGGSKLSLAWLEDLNICIELSLFKGPVWTAIGHEQDSGLLDEISLSAFHTPSKASQKIWDLLNQEYTNYTSNYEYVINKSLLNIENTENRNNELIISIKKDTKNKIEKASTKIEDIFNNLQKEVNFKIDKKEMIINSLINEIKNNSLKKLNTANNDINNLIKLIIGLGPSETLKRGYAIVVNKNNKLINSYKDAKKEEVITIRWNDSNMNVLTKNIEGENNE